MSKYPDDIMKVAADLAQEVGKVELFPGIKLIAAALAAERGRHTDKLAQVKALACGDRNPNWADDMAVTRTRMRIADIIDAGA